MTGAAEGTRIAGAERLDRTSPAGLIGLVDGVRRVLSAERDRWFLWLPVFIGTGIGLYFSLTAEPPLWLAVGLTGFATLIVAVVRWREAGSAAALAIAAVALGFGFAEIETL